MFTDSELEYLNHLSKIPSKETLDALYTTLVNLANNIDEVIVPVLAGQLAINQKERAILETFTRIQLWIRTIITLKQFSHFQGIASALRSIFELYLDLVILDKDVDLKTVNQYFTYAEVERYKTVYKITKFNEDHPTVKPDELAEYILQNSYNKQEIAKTVFVNWGLTLKKNGDIKFPINWTNKTKKQLAQDLGLEYEKLYLDIYPKLSWFVHSDPTGYQRMNEYVNITLLSYIYISTMQLLDDSTYICAKAFHIDKVIPHLKDKLLIARASYLSILVEQAKKKQSGDDSIEEKMK